MSLCADRGEAEALNGQGRSERHRFEVRHPAIGRRSSVQFREAFIALLLRARATHQDPSFVTTESDSCKSRALVRARPTQVSSFKMARNASCGTSTLPTDFMRFLPSFCFSSSLRLRLMSPP